MTDKIQLREVLAAIDSDAKDLWDELDESQQKTISSDFYILNRYISNVKHPSREIQEHHVLKVNQYFNKNWTVLQKHPKLLWMLLCSCSYDKTIFFHEWIGLKKKGSSNNKKVNFLKSIHPTKKLDEIDVLAAIITDNELKELAKDHGFNSSEIKQLLKK